MKGKNRYTEFKKRISAQPSERILRGGVRRVAACGEHIGTQREARTYIDTIGCTAPHQSSGDLADWERRKCGVEDIA